MKTFVKICWVSTCLPSPRNWCSFRDDCISRSRCARLPWFQASFQSTSAHSCSAVSATLDLVHLQECQTCVLVFLPVRPLLRRNPHGCRQNGEKMPCPSPVHLSFPPWPWMQGLPLPTALLPTLPWDFYFSEVSKTKLNFDLVRLLLSLLVKILLQLRAVLQISRWPWH